MLNLLVCLVCATVAGARAGEDVPLNHLQVLHAHNSYHLAPEDSILGILDSRLVQSLAVALVEQTLQNTTQSFEYSHASLTHLLDIWGVRSLELDCYHDPDGGLYSFPAARKLTRSRAPFPTEQLDQPGWKVLHIPDIDFNSSCFTLIECLQEIKQWSDLHSDHLPVFISIEPTVYEPRVELGDEAVEVLNGVLASRNGEPTALASSLPVDQPAFESLLDEILSVFEAEHIISPSEIKGSASNLVQAITEQGWPLVSQLRGRVLFIMSPPYTQRLLRVYPSLEGSFFFPSAYEDSLHPQHTVFVAVQAAEPVLPEDPSTWDATVEALVNNLATMVDQGFIVRGFADYGTLEARSNYTTRRAQVMAAGTHLVATDYPNRPSEFFDSTYSVQLQGGAVAVCNPRAADASCQNIDFVERTDPPSELTPSPTPRTSTLIESPNECSDAAPVEAEAMVEDLDLVSDSGAAKSDFHFILALLLVLALSMCLS